MSSSPSPLPILACSSWGLFQRPLPRWGGWAGHPWGSAQCPLPLSLQTSLRQMSQTRFYVVEGRALAPHVSLFVGGLPPGLSPQEYSSLLDEAVATKGVTAWAGLGSWLPGT